MPAASTRKAPFASTIAPVTSATAGTKPSTAERNIDNVVLGEVLFRAWYPSYHVKEIVGREIVDGKKEMLERLYVCKHCFKYSKELMSWMAHVKVCERSLNGGGEMIAGTRIYVHPPDGTWSIWEVDGEVDTVSFDDKNLNVPVLTILDHPSCTVKTYHYLQSFSLITNLSSSTSPALITSSSFIKTKLLASNK